LPIAWCSKLVIFNGGKMNDFKRARVTTTVGELITALSEEACPFSKSERETSIVVGYIFNDLLERIGCGGHRNARHHRRRRGTRGRRTNEKRL
jgi:hypothetical protein